MSDSFNCPHQDVCSALPAHLHFHAVASYSGLAALRAITINHHTAGLVGLQHLSIEGDAGSRLHEGLSARGIESIVLRTCNRSELYWRARVPGDDETAVAAFAASLNLPSTALQGVATQLTGEAVATHLFRVCSGLESLMVGEAEILGQVRTGLERCSGAGVFLDGVFRAALRTGRQARAETAIGAGALSVASTAVQWLSQHLSLADSRVVIVGAGDTGDKAARHLQSLGVGSLVIANRTASRGTALASTVGAEAVTLDALAAEIARADAVVCAANAPDWLVTLDMLKAASIASRRLVVVDLAMPSGVEPGSIPGVIRIDLEGLERLADLHRQQREAEVPKVEAVIARELEWLHAWARHQALRPLVSGLRRKVEAIRRAELARATKELDDAGATGAAVLERLSRRLLDQILAIPLAQLEAGELPLDATHAEYLRRLFALTDEPAAGSIAAAPAGATVES
jgi:glutamyl-tRNA reductase